MNNQNKSQSDPGQGKKKRNTRSSPPKRSAETHRIEESGISAQTEESLSAGEPQLQMMFDAMTEAVALNEIVYDDKGEMIDYRILNVNRAYFSIADYTGTQVIGNVATRLYGMTTEFIQSFWKEHRQKTTTAFTEMWSPLHNKCYFIATSPFVEDKFVTSFVDITERKLMEEALRESEEKWRTLVMTMPDFVAIHDGDGKYLFLNHFADGFSEKDVIGRSIYDFIKPDSRPLFKQEMDQVQKTGKMQKFEFKGLGVQSEPREYEETLVPMKSSNGETNILAFARDITENKQVEDKLHESEERYRDLVENSHELIYTHDLNGKLLSVNHTAALMLGYNPTSLVGRYLGELLAPEQRSQFKDYLDRIRRKVSDTGTWVLQSATGDRRTWEYHSMIRPDAKQGPYVRGMAHDITERMRVESALCESEERFQKIFDEGPIGMVLTSHYLQFFSANPAFCRMLGYTVEEMNSQTFLEVTHPEHREQDRQNMEKLWQGEIPEYRTQKRYIAKNGSIRWGSLSTSILHGQDGEPQYALTITEDITKRKYAEEATLRRNAELAALNQIGRALSKLAKPEEMLELIFKVIGQVMDNRNLFIALYDQASQTITFPVYTFNGERIFGGDRPLGNGITDYIIRTNTPFLVKQNLAEALAQRSIDLIGTPSRAFMAVPMCLGEKVIGVIALQDYDRENAYDEKQLELLTTIAAQAASALENARLFAAVQQELQELKQSEEKLGASESFNQALIKHSPIGVSVRNPNGQLLYTNDAWKRIWAMSDEAVSENLRRERKSLVFDKRDDYLQPHLEDIRKVYEEGGKLYLPNLKTIHPRTGAAEWVSQYFYALQDESGAVNRVVILTEDISERKRAEEELRASEARYRSLFENSVMGISQALPDGHFIRVNTAYAHMYGYENPETMMAEVAHVGKQLYANPEDRDEVLRILHEKGVMEPREIPVRRRDGTQFTVLVGAKEIKDPNGNLLCYQAEHIDITERKRMEEELRESEERQRQILENSLEVPYRRNLFTDTYDYMGPQIAQLAGFTAEEMISMPIDTALAHMHPDDLVNIQQALANSLANPGKHFQMEYRFKHRDGHYLWFQDHFTTKLDFQGRPVFLYGSVRDISERKQAEQALRQSEARYRAVLEQAAVGITQAISATGKYIDVNQKFCDIVGYSRDEILGTTFQNITHPDDLDADLEYMRQLREGKIRTFSMEKRYYRKDKSIIWVNLTVSPLWAVGEEPSSHVAVVEDITERKQAEAELAQSHEQLRALSQYLQAAREEERTFIAREIHDELGQELTALKMDLAWLSRHLPPEQTRLIQKTEAISDMVDGTIQTVRRVASQLRPGMLDDLGLVAALEWQAGEFQARTGIRCKLALPDNITTLSRDQATAMFRVFQETLTNIGRHAQATKVRVVLKEQPGCVELAVHDNGIGITKNQLTDPRSLGLTGMRERVQAFGGELEFKSAPDKGTSVRLRMPLVNVQAEREA